MGKSNYLENEILDHVLGAASFSAPSSVYVALFTAAPTDAGGGTEVSGGAYSRVTLTNNATNWPAASAGVKSNGVAINFPTATADWGTVVAFAIFDADVGGNMLYWASLDDSRNILNGDSCNFAVGDLDITED